MLNIFYILIYPNYFNASFSEKTWKIICYPHTHCDTFRHIIYSLISVYKEQNERRICLFCFFHTSRNIACKELIALQREHDACMQWSGRESLRFLKETLPLSPALLPSSICPFPYPTFVKEVSCYNEAFLLLGEFKQVISPQWDQFWTRTNSSLKHFTSGRERQKGWVSYGLTLY